jgi:hypothetical protein
VEIGDCNPGHPSVRCSMAKVTARYEGVRGERFAYVA